MDENTCMVEVARFFMNFTQRESCGKCVPCREGTKRMLEILERIVDARVRCPIWTSWKSLQIWFRTWLCADLARVHLFLLSVLSNASAMNMRNISAIKNAVQKYVLLFVSSTSTLSSVSAAVNVQRTVRQVQSQVRLNIHITFDNDICIKCGACKDNCNFDAVYVEA